LGPSLSSSSCRLAARNLQITPIGLKSFEDWHHTPSDSFGGQSGDWRRVLLTPSSAKSAIMHCVECGCQTPSCIHSCDPSSSTSQDATDCLSRECPARAPSSYGMSRTPGNRKRDTAQLEATSPRNQATRLRQPPLAHRDADHAPHEPKSLFDLYWHIETPLAADIGRATDAATSAIK
jgi:hypothetical protein